MTSATATARLPAATYRLQINRDLPFAAVTQLVEYWFALGISDLYLAPFLQARPGSLHGYDILNHSVVNPELGGEGALLTMLRAVRERGMGVIADVVPNHMCIRGAANHWWTEVLENGPSSPFARYFDIDWTPPKIDLLNKVLLPVLGDQYGRVIENGGIRVVLRDGAFWAEYGDLVFPIAPRSSHKILEPALRGAVPGPDADQADLVELESILTALRHLPTRDQLDPESVREREREKGTIKRRLASLVERSRGIRAAIEASVADLNGRPGDPRSFDRMEELLDQQAYRLCYWRVAADEINYRRFFDINELASIRVEDPAVFAAVHAVVTRLVREGLITGLRVDHVDGLRDPHRYLHDLKHACTPEGVPDARPVYIVVEKILGAGESLRADWPVHGSTGYDFLNLTNGLFIDPQHATAFRDLTTRLTGRAPHLPALSITCKKLVMLVSMASEVHVLAHHLDRVSEQHRTSRDFTLSHLTFALREIIACFPVYRTYVRGDDTPVGEDDRQVICSAVEAAKSLNPTTTESLFDFVGSVLLLQDPGALKPEQWAARRDFVLRFQQLTGPIMAKGIEDTAFYREVSLASLNEVGGDPGRFGIEPQAFHNANRARLENWPGSLCATSTHDSKRSEDTRARLDVLSELPGEWERTVLAWRESNRRHKRVLEGLPVPDDNEEYLFYQSVLGIWPLIEPDAAGHEELVRRCQDYMNKAIKEAKLHSSWVQPDDPYDQAVRGFIARALERAPDNAFLRSFQEFAPRVARAGMLNSLAQVVLKVAAPGVPDLYQGSETWNFRLVDPDNRGSVDFASLQATLATVLAAAERDRRTLLADLRRTAVDGRIKLYVTAAGLRLRRLRRELFARGGYVPLAAAGARARHVVSFARVAEEQSVIAAVARFPMSLPTAAEFPIGGDVWGEDGLILDGIVPPGLYRDAFSGVEIPANRAADGVLALPLARVFADLPVTLLERVG